jgi:hypothetical protein
MGLSALPQFSIVKPPLSPARQALRQAIADLHAAQDEAERVRKPADRLQQLIGAADRAERDLAELREADTAALGQWLAGGVEGARPEPSQKTLDCEHRVAELARDGSAARSMLPPLAAEAAASAQAVAEAARRRDEALVYAAGAAAEEVIAAELVPALEAVLKAEARLRGLGAALLEACHRSAAPIAAAGGISGQISEAIGKARAEVAVARDDDGGRRFLNKLAGDPEARL